MIQPTDVHRVKSWFRTLSPSQGWDTCALLLLAMTCVAFTIQDAQWVDTPGLLLIIFSSTVIGLIMARAGVAWFVVHLASLTLGSIFVVWQCLVLADGDSVLDRILDLINRIVSFYRAASDGGISTDLLPISILVLAFAWLMGYLGSWYLFRRNNVWVALVSAGLIMLTALSFLPESYTLNFFIFIFLAMMLVAKTTRVQQQRSWQESGVVTFLVKERIVSRNAILMSFITLIVVWLFPLNLYHSRIASDLWGLGRTPVVFLQDDFTRLLSAIPSRENRLGRFFGKSLPFLGEISFDEEIVFWADSVSPNYWLARTYSKYTSQGWFVGDTTEKHIGIDTPLPTHQELKRQLVSQSLQFSFKTDKLLAGGNINWLSRETVIETLPPLRFEIEIGNYNKSAEFPEEIQQIAERLRQEFSLPVTSFVESRISAMLPSDLMLERVQYSGQDSKTYVNRVSLLRRSPELPDVVAWRLTDTIQINDAYHMNSFVSDATIADLRKARTDYSGFIRDYYLQLPSNFPSRIRRLAQDLTRDAETPLDKTIAIQEYLRGGTFMYSKDIDKPPKGSDGVDHFLFETKTGYSDYFGSAMTVMLRSVGVPARLAAGFAPGERRKGSGRWAVKDSDSHGWTQVYFSEYGWIDFEPTPIRPRSEQLWPSTPSAAMENAGDEQGDPRATFDCPIPDDMMEDAEIVFDSRSVGITQLASLLSVPDHCDQPSESTDQTSPWLKNLPSSDSWIVEQAHVFVLLLVGIASSIFAGWLVWVRGLGDEEIVRTYTKMNRLGYLAGLRKPHIQTPMEYSELLGRAIPKITNSCQLIASMFAARRYGNREPINLHETDLKRAWYEVRFALFIRILQRLVFVTRTSSHTRS